MSLEYTIHGVTFFTTKSGYMYFHENDGRGSRQIFSVVGVAITAYDMPTLKRKAQQLYNERWAPTNSY